MVQSAQQYVMPQGHFDYSKMVVILLQGEGGNTAPYRKTIERLGLLSTVPVEVIEIKGFMKEETK